MIHNWQRHDVLPDLRLRITRPMPELAPGVDAEIDRLWQAAQVQTSNKLFNGHVFSADSITPHLINGHWTEFRRIVAQMRRPDLHADLGVRPLAVGGLVTGPDGVLFGRRPSGAVYQADMWQLPPAGSIDPGAALDDGWVDPLRQLLEELREELGLTAEQVAGPRPLCIVEHPGSHVLDLGIALTTQLSGAEIHTTHRHSGNTEYDPLMMVPLSNLSDFVGKAGKSLTPQAIFFLAKAGFLTH